MEAMPEEIKVQSHRHHKCLREILVLPLMYKLDEEILVHLGMLESLKGIGVQ